MPEYPLVTYLPRELPNGKILEHIPLKYDLEFMFSESNIQNIIDLLDFEGVYHEGKNLSGFIGEILANNVLSHNLETRLTSLRKYREIIGEELHKHKEYALNSSSNFVLRTLGSNRVVILKRAKKGYGTIKSKSDFTHCEIDGLYMIKVKSDIKKNSKALLVLESKTGKTNMDSEHIIEDIIKPLKEMYNTPYVNYALIGLPNEMYSVEGNKIFENNIQVIYNQLQKESVRFFPLVFPFDREVFTTFTDEIKSRRNGWKMVKGMINPITGETRLIDRKGDKYEGVMADSPLKS